jgi:hypothetical protein
MLSSYRSAAAGRPNYRTLVFRARVNPTHFIGKLQTRLHTVETQLQANVVSTKPPFIRVALAMAGGSRTKLQRLPAFAEAATRYWALVLDR